LGPSLWQCVRRSEVVEQWTTSDEDGDLCARRLEMMNGGEEESSGGAIQHLLWLGFGGGGGGGGGVVLFRTLTCDCRGE
jgi:hypothetical protein